MSDEGATRDDRQYGISFDIAKSMRYHAYRRGFFDRIDKLLRIMIIGTGGASFLVISIDQASVEVAWWAKTCLLVVTALTAFDTIIGFSGAARIHDKLYRDFALLAREVAITLKPDETKLSEWTERRLELETEEPGTMDWLERRCSKEEALSRGDEVNEAWRLPGWKIRLSQFVSG